MAVGEGAEGVCISVDINVDQANIEVLDAKVAKVLDCWTGVAMFLQSFGRKGRKADTDRTSQKLRTTQVQQLYEGRSRAGKRSHVYRPWIR